MSARTVARKEWRDAIRSRTLWALVVLVAASTGLGLGATVLVPGETDVLTAVGGAAQFAGLLVPILALVAAVLAIAGERDAGSIKLLLGLPASRDAVFLGKFLGRALVVVVGVTSGFALAAVVTALVFGTLPIVALGGVTLLAALLGVAYVGIAMGLSAIGATRSRAMTYGIAVYLLLGFLWDLVPQLALAAAGQAPSGGIPAWFLGVKILSPTGAFNGLVATHLGAISSGPGFAAGVAGPPPGFLSPWAMAAVLAVWTIVPLLLGRRAFQRADLS